MDQPVAPEVVKSFARIAPRYRAVLCDVWGVLHNGVRFFAPAVDALTRFRARGGAVILLTNAPRPWMSVREQLDGLGIPRDTYDAIVTSGDIARDLLAARQNESLFHLGPSRDHPLYAGLSFRFAEPSEAQLVSCTGLVDDEKETAADYEPLLRSLVARDIEMICANPDLAVTRGDKLIPCSGALAQRFVELGGRATIVGKPWSAIYDRAFAVVDQIVGSAVPRRFVLAIGDGAATDLKGAEGAGLSSLFIYGGVHEPETGTDPDRIAAFLRRHQTRADVMMPALVW